MNKKLFLIILLSFLGVLSSCTEKDESPEKDNSPKKPFVLDESFVGENATMRTSDDPLSLNSREMILSTGGILPDNTQFRIISESQTVNQSEVFLEISPDEVNYSKEIIVESKDGKIQFHVKPSAHERTYYFSAYPIKNDNIDFPQIGRIRFSVRIVAGIPFEMGSISFQRFEDLPSVTTGLYNGIMDYNEKYIVSAGSVENSIKVGPVKDKFGNLVKEGSIRLIYSGEGVISGGNQGNNILSITNGYAFFNFKAPDKIQTELISASVFGFQNLNIQISTEVKIVRPDIAISGITDFSEGMNYHDERISVLEVLNQGGEPLNSIFFSQLDSYFKLLSTKESVDLEIIAGTLTTEIDPILQTRKNLSQIHDIDNKKNKICYINQTLKISEKCYIFVKYTRPPSSVQNESFSIGGSPSISKSVLFTISNATPPVLTNTSFSHNFSTKACGTTTRVEFFIQNTGDSDAIINSFSHPMDDYNIRQFKIVAPAFDPDATTDINTVINCGEKVLSKRKCRFYLDFEPTLRFAEKPFTGYINFENVGSTFTVSSRASSGIGAPDMNSFSIFTKNPENGIETSSFLVNSDMEVQVSGLVDVCGNQMDGEVAKVTVSSGSLNETQKQITSGSASFIWTAPNLPNFLGGNYVEVDIGGVKKRKDVDVLGINLILSSNLGLNLGDYLINKEEFFTLKIKNNGNIKAEGLVPFFTGTNADDFYYDLSGTPPSTSPCSGSLDVGEECYLNVTSTIREGTRTSTVGLQSSTPGPKQTVTISYIGYPPPPMFFVDETDNGVILINDGSSSDILTKEIKIKNSGNVRSKDTVLVVPSPYIVQQNNCSTIEKGETCGIIISVDKSALSDADLVSTKTISLNNWAGAGIASAAIKFLDFNLYQGSIKLDGIEASPYSCSGPYNFKSIGADNTFRNIPVGKSINMSFNNTIKTRYFSDPSCLNIINSSNISSGQQSSSNFYIKSLDSSSISSVLSFTSNVQNKETLLSLSPLLNALEENTNLYALSTITSFALNNSQIDGDILLRPSDTNLNLNILDSYELSDRTKLPYEYFVGQNSEGEDVEEDRGLWSSASLGTSLINGNVFYKDSLFSSPIQPSTTFVKYDTDGTSIISTHDFSDYFTSGFLIERVSSWLDVFLKNRSPLMNAKVNEDYNNSGLIIPKEVTHSVTLQELSSVPELKTPSEDFLRTHIDGDIGVIGGNGLISGISLDGNVYRNTGVVNCSGEVVIIGNLLLNDANFMNNECTIYVSGIISITRTSGDVFNRLDEDLNVIDPEESSIISLYAKKGILIGIDTGKFNSIVSDESSRGLPYTLSEIQGDYLSFATSVSVPAFATNIKRNMTAVNLMSDRVYNNYYGSHTGSINANTVFYNDGALDLRYNELIEERALFPIFKKILE